jgi:hypothetical protein
MNRPARKEILEQVSKLSPKKQHLVLNFARSLAGQRPMGVPGKELLKFAGCIDPKDLRIMARAIEEACERVDPDAW